MAVQILPPISRTPGAQDDYPFIILNPNGSKRNLTNDFIEIVIGDSSTTPLFAANSSAPTKVEKDDPTNGGVTVHVSPDEITGAPTVTRYSVRLTPGATAPSAATTVIGEGEYTIKAAMFQQPSFDLVPEQSAVSVAPGGGAVINVNVNSVAAFADTVALVATVSPVVVNGPAASISTPAVVPSGGSDTEILTITTVPATPPGSYVITVTGTVGSLTRTATVALTVT